MKLFCQEMGLGEALDSGYINLISDGALVGCSMKLLPFENASGCTMHNFSNLMKRCLLILPKIDRELNMKLTSIIAFFNNARNEMSKAVR